VRVTIVGAGVIAGAHGAAAGAHQGLDELEVPRRAGARE
jgi:hypothetical protein